VIGRTRAERKRAALLRAQLSLKHAVERIDYDFDVIHPALNEMRQREITEKVNVIVEEGDLRETGD
jgi:hypothetical protein